MQSISLTPNGVISDSGLDWELTTSDTAPGPITVDTDDFVCSGYEARDSLGRNNNGVVAAVGGSLEGDSPSACAALAAALACLLLATAWTRRRSGG